MGFAFVKMVNLRQLLVKFEATWNDLRHLVKSYLNSGRNRCLDLIMIGGGIHPVPGTEPWKRNCLILYRLLGFYQFIMALARVGCSLQNLDDLVGLCASITVATAMATGYLKVYVLDHYGEIVRQSRTFLGSQMNHSGDPDYNASVRRDATRAAGKVTLAICLLLCCNQVFGMVPNSARNHILGIPKQFHALGSSIARLLQESFVFMIFIFWGFRYFCCSLTVMQILTGLLSELMIVTRGYETIEERVRVQVSEELNIAAGPSRKLQPSVLRWKHLKQILGTTLEQHIDLLRNIQLVQPFVSIVYAIIYYSAMVFVSLHVWLAIRGGVTLVSIVMVVTACFVILECYCWCRLINLFEDNMEKIADSAAQLGCGLEHSVDSHSDYIQMRTSLMIIQLNASRREWFSCGGIFPISVESFGDLCMIIYRFITFLLNFD